MVGLFPTLCRASQSNLHLNSSTFRFKKKIFKLKKKIPLEFQITYTTLQVTSRIPAENVEDGGDFSRRGISLR